MAEVNRVMEQISRHCEQAQIIMGAAVDETLKNRLCVTVIAAKQCRCREPETPGDLPEQTFSRGATARTAGHAGPAMPSLSLDQREQMMSRRGTRGRKAGFKNAANAIAAGDCLQRPVRQERADHPQGRRPRHPDLHPPRRGVELNLLDCGNMLPLSSTRHVASNKARTCPRTPISPLTRGDDQHFLLRRRFEQRTYFASASISDGDNFFPNAGISLGPVLIA